MTTTIEPYTHAAGGEARAIVPMCQRQLNSVSRHLGFTATEGEDILAELDLLMAQIVVLRKLTESMIRDAPEDQF